MNLEKGHATHKGKLRSCQPSPSATVVLLEEILHLAATQADDELAHILRPSLRVP